MERRGAEERGLGGEWGRAHLLLRGCGVGISRMTECEKDTQDVSQRASSSLSRASRNRGFEKGTTELRIEIFLSKKRLTSKMSHDRGRRAACGMTIWIPWFHFNSRSIARGVTAVVVGSGALLGERTGRPRRRTKSV